MPPESANPAIPTANMSATAMTYSATMTNGQLVFDQPLPFAEGAKVRLEVVPANDEDRELAERQRTAIMKLIEELDALPSEGPDDGFSGSDHDRVLYGDDPA
jgi:hypothetical protein